MTLKFVTILGLLSAVCSWSFGDICSQTMGEIQTQTLIKGVVIQYSPLFELQDSSGRERWVSARDRVFGVAYSEQLNPIEFRGLARFKSTRGKELNPLLQEFHEKALESIYDLYGPAINEDLKQSIREIESKIPIEQQNVIVVQEQNGNVLGGLRIVEGIHLPSQIILEKRGGHRSPALDQLTSDTQHLRVLELGKFFAFKGDSHRRTVQLLEKLFVRFLERYLDQVKGTGGQEVIIAAHVATKAHEYIYQKNYGFEVVDRISVSETDQEAIMTVKASELIDHLKQRTESAAN